ncbi:MAG: thiamine pyrophosphate-dependent enzyme [Sandaracinaceae bacterium]|nr:thiamine pyrophosphate-dependent enzyme [Sandaracinaceae bacterium]
MLAIYAAVKEAADRARGGGGPTFLEHVTYRMGPHSSSDDPTRYRSDEEVAEWGRKDPIDRFERYLRRAELLDDAAKGAILAELEREISAAIDEVEELGPPERGSLFDDLYAREPERIGEQRRELEASAHAPRGH